MSDHDLIVVGGGTAGLVASAGAAGIGARVALIERHRLGGECLWTGCVPSKALIACARAAHAVRTAGRFGVHAGAPRIDFSEAMRWVRAAEERIAPHDSPERFRGLGVDVIAGTARFVAPRTLDVDGRRLSAKRILLATGSAPAVPPIAGLGDVPFLTNETIFSIARQPRQLIILGGGPVGLELAQAFARLGTVVRVIEVSPRILPREDRELGDTLATLLAAEGIELLLGVTVTRARAIGDTVSVDGRAADGRVVTVEGDALLVAAGRVPNLAELDLARGGVRATDAGVTVNARLRTSARGVWAAGDVTGAPRFTHVADYQARLVVRNAFFPVPGSASYDAVPRVTFTDPELARVGLTEDDARERFGARVRVWRHAFADNDRAVVDGETAGLVKLVTDARGTVLGAHVLGHGAGNMIGELVLAMRHGVSASQLAGTIHAYPTYPESIRQAGSMQLKARFTGVARSIARYFARR